MKMSEKPSHKKERRSSSSSSSYSSSSSVSSSESKKKVVDKKKKQSHLTNPLGNVNKVKLDIGYKIQQEEISDSEDSNENLTPPKFCSKNNDKSVLKYSDNKDEKRDRSKSDEKKRYQSPSKDKKRERSCSIEYRKDRSQSKDIKHGLDLKMRSKYEHSKSLDRKDRSKSKERKRERSRSRDRRKRRSKSREKKLIKSPSRDKKKERSRSKDKKRDRSKSRDRVVDLFRTKDKRRERSRSREKRREKSRRESRSPSYYKDSKLYGHSKRGRSRERSYKRSHSRSRSRSRPRKRSRSRSFERTKRGYDKKNKLSILEKLGIELKVPEGQIMGEPGANTSGFSIPSYYNPAGVNPLKYAQQIQKRRLIWGNKKQGETSVEKKEEEKEVKLETAGPESVWKGTTFSQDQDGKLTAKFKRLMGIKDSGESEGNSEKNSELIQKQEEMFSSMEKQYEVARVSTHTHRGLGLGFGVHLPR